MALDNAQFISELSITDPPGTDAIAEGDDHIRTTKRATQQSFPNVDAAVPQTAAQMGQMAIKNEANTFSGFNIFTVQQTFEQDVIRVVAGANESGFYFCNSETTFRRWAFGREDTDASGDWVVQRRGTNGVVQDTPFRIAQSNGRFTFTQPGFFQGGSNIDDVSGTQTLSVSFNSGGSNDWAFANDNSGANSFRFRRFINGAPQTDLFNVTNSTGKLKFFEPYIIEMPNDRLQLRRSATPSPTARVGHSLRREDNTKMWEIYADNNDDFHMNQRRTVGGSAAGTSIKILFASGHIVMAQLPTSAPATSKTLWMSSGFVAITP